MNKIPINIVIGRFQPFTNGHMKCIDEAYKKFKVPTIICLIDTPETKVDKRHPFSTDILLPIYKELAKDYKNIIDIITVKNADIVKIGEVVNDKYIIRSWTCGTDRIDSYTKMSNDYKEKAGLADDFEMIEVKRGDEDVSATKAREALINGDVKTFNALTPYNTLRNHLKEPNRVYNILREEILKLN